MGKLSLKKNLLLLLTVFIINSCQQNDEIEVNLNDLLIGNWVSGTYQNETLTFQRVNSLNDDAYGISFKSNGNFIERSSGWCGTPPLTFFDYQGSWQTENTLIKIVSSNSFNGGINWRVVSLTETELIVKRELTEQEKEHQVLMNLFYEFQEIAQSIPCSNSNDWNFTAYGSKACGGPQGYIAYSTQINITNFLKKVVDYTNAEDDYNKKWGIGSTCDIPPKPTAVECQNGVPVLKY